MSLTWCADVRLRARLEPGVRARFQAARDDEYGEIAGKCERSLGAYAARVCAEEAEGQ
jgi:hypothetical protein